MDQRLGDLRADRQAGFSEVNGSWKTMPMRLPRSARRSLAGSSAQVLALEQARPAAMLRLGPSRPRIASAIVLLPEPDSPTSAERPPCGDSKRDVVERLQRPPRVA